MSRRRSKALSRVRGMRPSQRLLAVLAVLLVLSGSAALLSSATFTATTPGRVTVGAAEDYTEPTARVVVPTVVSGTVAVVVDAQDTRTSVTRVVVEKRPAGSATWTTLCITTTAPWTCAWDTTAEPDGDVSLRATATDSVGLSGISPVVTTRVANAAAVAFGPLPDAARGTFSLNATVTGAAGRTVTSSFAYRLVGSTGGWTAITGCSSVTGTSPVCTWNTGSLTNDYEIRVESTFAGGQVVRAFDEVSVDNTLPTATLALPSPLSGTVVIAPTVADADSGVAIVAIDYRVTGAPSWVSLCTREVSPYRCALDTTALTNGTSYDVRVTVRDVAGNERVVSLTRLVSNVSATISITNPEADDFLRGVRTIDVAANAGTGGTISSVVIQGRLKGPGAFVTICSDTTAPYGCSWDTTPLAPGTYELRAQLISGSTVVATSVLVPVFVDNSPLQAFDVQGTPGPGVSGRLDDGDTLTLTYTTLVNLSTIRSNWDGSPVSATATLRGKNVTGAGTGLDRLDLPGLGQITYTQTLTKPRSTVSGIPVTLSASTETVNGTPSTVITVTIGSFASNDLRTNNTAGTLRWSPSTSVRTPDGQASAAAPATESGALDADL